MQPLMDNKFDKHMLVVKTISVCEEGECITYYHSYYNYVSNLFIPLVLLGVYF